MPRGGSKPGERRGGRKKGTPNGKLHPKRLSAIAGIEMAKAHRVTPLEVLLGIGNRDPRFADYTDREVSCMIAAAPYCHARLTAVAYVPPPDDTRDRRREMLRRLTYQQRKAIEEILAAGEAAKDGPEIEGEAAEEQAPGAA
jgi:hypothetical protein